MNYTLHKNQKSIHIVIFTGGEAPEPSETKTFWKNPLHGEADYVIAADSGLETLEKFRRFYAEGLDFYPDLITGDFDSLSSRKLLDSFSDCRIDSYNCDKDFTDTELALRKPCEYAASVNAVPYITLIGGDGGRTDHFINILSSFSSDFHCNSWLCKNQLLLLLEKGSSYFISGLKKSDYVSFVNIYSKGNKIKTEGLCWESEKFRTSFMPSISNRISPLYESQNKPVKVKPCAEGFIVIVPYSASVIKI